MADDNRETYVEAAERLEEVALKLLSRLPAIDVSGVFVGVAATVLVQNLGRDGAVDYLRKLADEIEAEPDAPRAH